MRNLNNVLMKNIVSVFFMLLVFCSFAFLQGKSENTQGWKAGVAKVKITPKESIWIAGYINRDHPSEGKLQNLWAKALALEDSNGTRVVLITTDLVGFGKSMSDTIRDRLNRKYNLSRSQIILNSSHTHSGPIVSQRHALVYGLSADEELKVKNYSEKLEDLIVNVARKALNSMKPVQLYSANGITRFQVNRRNNIEKDLSAQTELKGPNDYSVPVLKVVGPKGKLLAVAFGYACHATVLNGYQWSSDYPGYAQEYLEKQYPGAIALFFQGTGGDQNPLPRRSVALARQYGNELGCAVQRVLDEEMNPLTPKISTDYSEIEIEMEVPPSKEELRKKIENTSGYEQHWAKEMYDYLDSGKSFPLLYPYPLEVWKLGEQLLVAMGGEPTIEYTLKMKQILGKELFVLGYSNDVMSYIPSCKVLEEGGYEGGGSQMYFRLPNKWKPSIEEKILSETESLATKVGANIIESNEH